MLFYALMPTCAALVFPLRKTPLLAVVAFILIAWISDKYLTYDIFRLPGMTGYLQFFLSPFLVGMASAYMAQSIKQSAMKLHGNQLLNCLVSFGILGCLISFQWLMIRIYANTGENVVGNWALYMSIGCCALILWTTSASENWLCAVLSFQPLRIIGIVGYSFYLWHWVPVILLPHEWAPILRFSIALVATFSASLATFFIIERPGIRLGAKLASMLYRPPAMAVPAVRPAKSWPSKQGDLQDELLS